MADSANRLRVVIRASSQFSLLGILEHGGFLAQAGLALETEFIPEAAPADARLFEGDADLIFGSHISPYSHLADGVPMAALAQTVNFAHESFATRRAITDLSEADGMVVAGAPLINQYGDVMHPIANHLLLLERAGIDADAATYIDAVGEPGYAVVARGDAGGAFLRPYHRAKAEALGLSVLDLAPLPMVNSITLTTLAPNAEGQPESFAALVRALASAIRFFHEYPDETRGLLADHVSGQLGLETTDEIERLYAKEAARLDPSLLPRPDSIMNAFRLAEKYGRFEDLAARVNPMRLWDLRHVVDLHRSGFYERPLEIPDRS